jgi:DNA invertase Pin-like site-specific DNA recombinase
VSRTLVVDGYVRVAEGGTSAARHAAVTRWKIADWTRARGWRLGRLFEDGADDGGGARSLSDALARVESHESDGLVVARVDQIGHSLPEVLAAIERIEAAGGAFASVLDGLDLSTPAGRLVLRVLVSVREPWLSSAGPQ